MLRGKRFVIIGLLAAVVLVGSLAGLALAQTVDTGQPQTLLARVATILGIDQQKVEDAFSQAQKEMQNEALDSYLKNLVDQGKITQQQADQYKAWWQARPDMSQYNQQLQQWQQARPSLPPELKQWQETRPDIPSPGPFGGLGGHGFRGGMRWGGGF